MKAAFLHEGLKNMKMYYVKREEDTLEQKRLLTWTIP